MKKKLLIPLIALGAVFLAAACTVNPSNGSSEFFMNAFWRWVITTVFGFVANYGLRVVVLTICLKLLLSPIDFYTRKKNKDNARIMLRIQPEIEKLSKQYANDPRELQTKKSALQKKSGYSLGSTCLPLILTMFIFITLWQGFTAIANQMNKSMYDTLQSQYYRPYFNDIDAATASAAIDGYRIYFIENELTVNAAYYEGMTDTEKTDAATAKLEARLPAGVVSFTSVDDEGFVYVATYYAQANGIPYVFVSLADANAAIGDYRKFFIANDLAVNKSIYDKAKYSDDERLAEATKTLEKEFSADITDFTDTDRQTKPFNLVKTYLAQMNVFRAYEGLDINGERVGKGLKEEFLWIKNIWRADTWNNPIPNAEEYAKAIGVTSIDSAYNDVMARVGYEYIGVWNGWLILVVLSVGLNFLNQFIAQKQQGANNAATATAGAPGMAGTMKIMMYMMPLMFGFFALTYSSAFTIYMVTNATMTLIVNLGSSWILKLVDKKRDGGGGGVPRIKAAKPVSQAKANRDKVFKGKYTGGYRKK
ncbi:MAG: YidC/Oxa1 family membrane protein insertase [Clostridiales bacterium]|jgi:membrane protein insertase Oxa1/YidC/SpoIIIJ|nr:YidC/Oxa1 family membrane protein insertase [Clostridiales bacterium]